MKSFMPNFDQVFKYRDIFVVLMWEGRKFQILSPRVGKNLKLSFEYSSASI